jgi:hypothetical protein
MIGFPSRAVSHWCRAWTRTGLLTPVRWPGSQPRSRPGHLGSDADGGPDRAQSGHDNSDHSQPRDEQRRTQGAVDHATSPNHQRGHPRFGVVPIKNGVRASGERLCRRGDLSHAARIRWHAVRPLSALRAHPGRAGTACTAPPQAAGLAERSGRLLRNFGDEVLSEVNSPRRLPPEERHGTDQGRVQSASMRPVVPRPSPQMVQLRRGDRLAMTVEPVVKAVARDTIRMLATTDPPPARPCTSTGRPGGPRLHQPRAT